MADNSTRYKGVVFFDLDGTLYDDQSKVTPEVNGALIKMEENGYLPVICTGRSPIELKETLTTTGLDSYVSLNGAYVVFHGNMIYSSEIPKETIEEVLDIADQSEESIGFYGASDIAISANTDDARITYDYVNYPLPPVNHNYWNEKPVYMMIVFTPDNDAAYKANGLSSKLTYYRNSPFSIDTVNKGISKRQGIKTFIKNADLEGIPTYAFGDGANDLTMLSFVDHPVAMGNGIPETKELAEFVTTENINNGIINGLKHFNMI